VIVAAVAVTVALVVIGIRAGLPPALSGIGAGLIALGMVHFLARGMTSPLRQMAAAATAMARGDYGLRVRASSRDEVGRLADAFNVMAAELEEVDRMRRDLVANVSHELRTPISALQAVLENLVDGVEAPDAATLETMLDQVQRLGRLVAQLLDLSRLESGALELRPGPFELRALLERAAQEQIVRLRQRDRREVDLVVDVIPPEIVVDADEERLHQVIANLLDNAVRHSPEGGEVRVSARRSAGGVRLEVVDEGPGIPAGDATRVFERFYRSDEARSASEGGTGLGLAITRWIVDLHGGEIAVDPAAGRGCRMVVVLPQPALVGAVTTSGRDGTSATAPPPTAGGSSGLGGGKPA
jgi:signal transduction histidine kinase